MDLTTFYYILAAVLVVIGILGTILPALPGLPLVFIGMLLASWASGFEKVGWVTLVVLGLLTVLSMVIDFAATALGAKRVGASRLAIIGSIVGTFAGLAFGFVGVFIGPFVGAVAMQLLFGRNGSVNLLLDDWLGF